MVYTIEQETIGNNYIVLEVSPANGRDVYKVISATECGAGYREDKTNTYTDLKKAKATYNRYRREAKNA